MTYKKFITRAGAIMTGLVVPVMALAQTDPFNRAKSNLETTVQKQALGATSQVQSVYTIAGNLINVALGFLGILLLGYMLYAGFLWMTSGGDTERSEKALTMIRNAVIGLVIIVAAFAISSFVLGSLVNVSSGNIVG